MTSRGLHVLPPKFKLEELARQYLNDDVPSFDFGGMVVGSEQSQANIYFKSQGVVAGIPFAQAIFDVTGCVVSWHYQEGDMLTPDTAEKEKIVLGSVTGRACDLLLAERTVLNIMSRASGIATQVLVRAVYFLCFECSYVICFCCCCYRFVFCRLAG
jgi:nicotinate-nucleotide pyrophosphorylase (carboxylating)